MTETGRIARARTRLHTLRVLSRLSPSELQAVRRLAEWVDREHVAPTTSAGVDPSAWISPLASLRFADRIEIGAKATVGPFCAVWGGTEAWTRIGTAALLAPGVTVVAGNHRIDGAGPIRDTGFDEHDATIGDGAWIGAHATIIGCHVGSNAVVGAGSVVTEDIPAGAIAAGSPARVLRWRGDQ